MISRQFAVELPLQAEASQQEVLRLWQVAQSRKWLIGGLIAAGVLLALGYTAVQVPLYSAETTVELLSLNRDFLNLKDVDPTSGPGAEVSIATQVQLLRSSTLVERAVKRVENRNLKQLETGPAYPVIGILGFRRPPARVDAAIAAAAANLAIQPRGDSQLVEIATQSTDARVAAEFANALAQEYIERSLELRWNSYQRTGEWLAKKVGELREKLKKSETELLDHASRGGFMFGTEEQNPTRAKLEQLQAEYSTAQAARMARQSKYEQISTTPSDDALNAGEYPSLSTSTQKLNDLRRELADLRAIYAPAHYKVKQAEAQIASVEAAARKERGAILDSLRSEYETSRRREALLQQAYEKQLKLASQQASNLINYGILKREVETTRNLYESMLQRVNEAGTAAALRESSARVIDLASPSSKPSHPNPARNVVFGVICGVFVAVVLTGLQELQDSSMKTPEDVMSTLQLPGLGVIPSALPDGTIRRSLPLLTRSERGMQLTKWNGEGGPLVESFRSVLLSLMYSSPTSDKSLVVVVASPSAQEGKTTVTSNLGAALASSGRRVLVVDADVRRPALHKACGVENVFGVSDMLHSGKPMSEYNIEEIARPTEVKNLYILSAGTGGSEGPWVDSRRLIEFVARCRHAFPTVLIDTPPILAFADSRVWARCSDGAVLVVRAGGTPRVAAKLAARRFLEDATPVIGTILNDWDPKQFGHGYARYHAPYTFDRYENQKQS